MTKYKIVYYNRETRNYILLHPNGSAFTVDIFVGGFMGDELENSRMTTEQLYEFEKRFVGKEIMIEELDPLTYSTSGEVKIIPSDEMFNKLSNQNTTTK